MKSHFPKSHPKVQVRHLKQKVQATWMRSTGQRARVRAKVCPMSASDAEEKDITVGLVRRLGIIQPVSNVMDVEAKDM